MRNVFSRAIVAAAQKDPKVLLLTGDHGYALFDAFRQQVPDQFINAGVAEQNMVGVAAGLAKAGFKPIVYGLSAFVPVRVLEQIKMDVCYEGLPVTFIGDGAGLVYSTLGASHQCTEDIAVLRPLPGMSIYSPCDVHEMEYVLTHALSFRSPAYVRMGKSDVGAVHGQAISANPGELLPVMQGMSKEMVFLATGSMVSTACALAEEMGGASVWSAPVIKPINADQVHAIAAQAKTVVVIEEHSIVGGLGSLVSEIVSETGAARVLRFGVGERFSERCGSYAYLLREHGLTLPALEAQLRDRLSAVREPASRRVN